MPTIIFKEYDGTMHEVNAEVGSSVMEAATLNGVPGIDADCGGSAVCGTCHCFVESEHPLPAPEMMEESMLGLRPDRETGSRLSCQLKVTEDLDGLRIRLPEFQM